MDILSNINKNNLRLANIDEWKLAPLSCFMPQNGLLNKLFSSFKDVIFSKSEFLASTSISKTRYRHLGSQKKNLYYLFNDQLNFALA